jgi:hypothetical protein
MVDLFSRETMLEFLPDRKMERVCQAIMKRIIFSRGVHFRRASFRQRAGIDAGNRAAGMPIPGHIADSDGRS